ncbi:MAG: bifunctional serine/threonine-protein kinase/formylglycine-generating enzyme family protein, partial [Planctomycetota bacterium]|nr:bifunctional serine/threonine-protein kinase/formylglycine-generating enzyme family protein [Planctomycetota bacterium]
SGTVNQCPYFIMTWHSGKSLDRFMRDAQGGEDLDEFWLRRFFRRLAEILDYCHDNGVVHRDLKPENILVDPRGEPILIDFGLVKLNEELVEESETGGLSLTKTGELLGTPAFMSPEQLNSKENFGESPEASDVWGLGATLYYALTGCPPFQTESLTELYVQILNGKPTDIYELNPSASKTLANLTRRILVQDPGARPGLGEIMELLDPKSFGKAQVSRTIIAAVLSLLILTVCAAFVLVPMLFREAIVIAEVDKVPAMTKESSIVISGRLSRGPANLEIGTKVVEVDETGLFKFPVTLKDGVNRILLQVSESDAVEAFQSVEIFCDRRIPGIALFHQQSPEGIYLCGDDYLLKGQLIDKHPMSVSADKNNFVINKRGEFAAPLVRKDAVQDLFLIGRDKAGNEVEKRVKVQEKGCYEKALEKKKARDVLAAAERKAKDDRLANKIPTIDEYPLLSDFEESITQQREAYGKLFNDPKDSQLIAPLLEFETWQRTPRMNQEATIAWVGKRIGNDFEFLGGRTYQCGDLSCYIGRFKHKKTGLILHLIPGGAQVKRWFSRPARGHGIQVMSLLSSDKLFKSLLRYVLFTNAPGRGFRHNFIRDSKVKEKIDGFDELMAEFKDGPLTDEKVSPEPDVFDYIVKHFFEDEFQFQWLKKYFKALYKANSKNEPFFFSGEYTPPYLIGQNEVSQRTFSRFGAGAEILDKLELSYGRGDELPIYKISHNEVSDWLKKVGSSLRFPTELEWSHAFMGGSKAAYFWGDDGAKSKDYIWSHQVGQKLQVHKNSEHKDRTNSFGLIDMAGNVGEWCEDSFEVYFERVVEAKAKTGRSFPPLSKVAEFKEPFMGGSIIQHWLVCHPKFAKYDVDDSDWQTRGFRVACSIPLTEK